MQKNELTPRSKKPKKRTESDSAVSDSKKSSKTTEKPILDEDVSLGTATSATPTTFVDPTPTNPTPAATVGSKRVGLLLVGALLVVFVAGLLYSVQAITPEERLQKVISNTAEIKTVRQQFNAKGTDNSSGTKQSVSITSLNDFSNPSRPKSSGDYTIVITASSSSLNVKNSFICISEKLCYAKYTKISISDASENSDLPELNKWLEFNPNDDSDSIKADPFKITSGVNTVLGEIISGSISGKAKQAIDQSVGEDKAYTITSSKQEKFNSSKSIHYVVKLDADKVLALNKLTATQYKIANVFEDNSEISESIDLWVDPNTNLIQKLSSKKDNITASITFSNYDETVKIQAPGTSI